MSADGLDWQLEPKAYSDVLASANPVERLLAVLDLDDEADAVQIHNQLVTVERLERIAFLLDNLSVGGGQGLTSDTFVYKGNTYVIPDVVRQADLLLIGNQTYVDTDQPKYTNVTNTELTPGEDVEFARIEVSTNEFLLLEKTAATAHEDLRYKYFVDDEDITDKDLTGDSPVTTPDNLANGDVVKDGYMLVEKFVSLRLENTGNDTLGGSGSENLAGILKGLKMEEK